MKKWVKANLNDSVRVKVTETGLKQFNAFYENLNMKPPVLEVDKDGWTDFCLWELANIFGEGMYNGCDVPVETSFEIEVDDVDNE